MISISTESPEVSPAQLQPASMSLPDYNSLGFKDIIVTLDGAVAVILINRPKESVHPRHLAVAATKCRSTQEKLY